MANVTLDAMNLRCPQPVLKIAAMLPDLAPGDIVEIQANCPTFEADVRKWCQRMRKTLLSLSNDGSKVTAVIQI